MKQGKRRELTGSLKGRAWMLFALMLVMASACSGDNEPQNQRDAVFPVTVKQVVRTDVNLFREYPARIHGSRQVQVRAMVQGILKEKQYEEGRLVERDDVLFRIDPEPYQIALRRALAERADASANYDSALREKNRYVRLYEQKAVSTQERDRAATQYEHARARLELTEATLADAQRNLRYTEVRAPVAGITGMESISEGNLVEWGRLLTTITQIDPVHVHFSIPERDAVTHRSALARYPETSRFESVTLIPGRETALDRRGEIDFTAGTIDPRTGTVTARAVFSNADTLLLPGQFVRVRMLVDTLEDIILVPETVISQSRQGVRLFVVDEDDRARERLIRKGPVVDGMVVVLAGLKEGERVVTDGHVALREGMPVSVEAMPDSADGPTESENAVSGQEAR